LKINIENNRDNHVHGSVLIAIVLAIALGAVGVAAFMALAN